MVKCHYFAEIDEYYTDVRYERIAILNALGAYYSYLGKIETMQREKEDHFIQATQYYNKASRIDMHEPSTWIGKGIYHFAVACALRRRLLGYRTNHCHFYLYLLNL